MMIYTKEQKIEIVQTHLMHMLESLGRNNYKWFPNMPCPGDVSDVAVGLVEWFLAVTGMEKENELGTDVSDVVVGILEWFLAVTEKEKDNGLD